MRGLLIAFEGLDQSGKQTQAEWLRDRLIEAGRRVRLLSFPAYETPIGVEIRQGLAGARDWGADVMQLLYIANRYEARPLMESELAEGTILVCDRYMASSSATRSPTSSGGSIRSRAKTSLLSQMGPTTSHALSGACRGRTGTIR